MQFKSFMEALKGKQHKIDKNKNGQIDSHDFKLLRKEEQEEVAERYDPNRAALAKQRISNLRHAGRKVAGSRIANLLRTAGIREESEVDDELIEQLDEVLVKDAGADKWIHDFVHSTNPKFEGKSKKERINMALGAYYDTHKKKDGISEAVQKVDVPAYLRKQQGQAPLKLSDLKRKDTISDKDNLAKLRNQQEETMHKFSTHAKIEEGRNEGDVPFDKPYKTVTTPTVKDKSGAVHTPMSRARDLARKAMNNQKPVVPVKEETDTSEKHEMAETQLHFIKYAAEEILEYIEMGGEIEEWYQNKLSKVQSEVESLHSYIEGESRRQGMKEEVSTTGPVNVKVQVAGKEPHEEKWASAKKKPVKEEIDADGNVTYAPMTYNDFKMVLEYEADKGGRYVHKGSYGSEFAKAEREKDEKGFDAEPAKRGPKAGSKRGPRANLGNSKLHKTI